MSSPENKLKSSPTHVFVHPVGELFTPFEPVTKSHPFRNKPMPNRIFVPISEFFCGNYNGALVKNLTDWLLGD